MSGRIFRGQESVIEIDGEPLGIIDDPEVSVTKNIEEGRGAGPTTWFDLQQTEVAVEVSGQVIEWDLDLWKDLVGYDELADELRDDAEVPTVDATVIYSDTNGDDAVLPVKECYSENTPVGGAREEWIGINLDLRGRTISGVDEESDDVEA